jgi:hypothetical protein
MNVPKDLNRTDDPLEIFRRTTRLIAEQQAAVDKTAAMRALAVAALYARGYTYKQLASLLDLSAPRVGQLVGSTDEAAILALRAWAEIERRLAQIVDLTGGDTRSVYRSAIAVLSRSDKFDDAALEDLEKIGRIRNELIHARRDISPHEAEILTDKALYLNALLQVFLTEETKRRKQLDASEKVGRSIDWKASMVRVRWEDLERTPLYEDMVSVLLSRLHPDAERIDGIGGDGGRDVQLRTPERLELFELKSFTGRITARSPNRRRQIEESLRTAARLRPDSWSLVVPIDHNKEELKWFDGLRRIYPFPLRWYGRTWLDGQMAAFPDIQRYYIEGIRDEVLELLRQLNEEQSALGGGAVDAIARFDRLRSRLNELDPQYRFELIPGPAEMAMTTFPQAAMYSQRQGEHGPVTIAVISKYLDAARDRPIMVKADLRFPETEIGQEAAARFHAFLDYGDPAIVDEGNVQKIDVNAPGGLGGTLGRGTLQIGPLAADTVFLLDARFRALNEGGSQLASLPVRFTTGHGGLRGRVITGQDATGVLHISVRFDETERQVKVIVNVRPVNGLLPASLLAPLRLARALRRPNIATVTVAEGDLWDPTPMPDLDLVPSEYLELVEQLARVQVETNTPFPLPNEIDAEDVAMLHRLVRLFDGEPLALRPDSMDFTLKPGAQLPWRADKEQEEGFLALESEMSQTLMGEVVPLGLCNIVIGPSTFVEEAISDPTLPPSHIRVRLIPHAGARALLRRGPLMPKNDAAAPKADAEY